MIEESCESCKYFKFVCPQKERDEEDRVYEEKLVEWRKLVSKVNEESGNEIDSVDDPACRELRDETNTARWAVTAGHCRRFPPLPLFPFDQEEDEIDLDKYIQPMVHKNIWCGEFKEIVDGT